MPGFPMRAVLSALVVASSCALCVAAASDEPKEPDTPSTPAGVPDAEGETASAQDDTAGGNVDPDAEPAVDAAAQRESAAAEVQAILSDPLGEDDYRDSRNCLRLREIDQVEILDDRVVVFHGRGRRVWINQLLSQCVGLRPDMVASLSSYTGSICRLDTFRGIPRFGGVALTAHCRLGSFEAIDEVQLDALRGAIEGRDAASR